MRKLLKGDYNLIIYWRDSPVNVIIRLMWSKICRPKVTTCPVYLQNVETPVLFLRKKHLNDLLKSQRRCHLLIRTQKPFSLFYYLLFNDSWFDYTSLQVQITHSTQAQTHMHTHIHTLTYTHTHTQTHTHTHTHTHTQPHTHWFCNTGGPRYLQTWFLYYNEIVS